MSRIRSALLVPALLALLAPGARGDDLPPAPSRWVTDQAGLLSPGARRALDARLEAYDRSTGHQLLVWIGRTTGGVPIEDFAVRAFAAWKVGRKGIDDGLVLFVFAQDRTLRFEVGYGLEDKIPDAIASRIIREVIVPRIQAGDADAGIRAGMDAAITVIEGRPWRGSAEAPAAPSGSRPPPRSLGVGQLLLMGLLGVGFLILLITNPTLALFLLVQILSGGRGGGGGGGGFSGGGGRSGGGGASGSW